MAERIIEKGETVLALRARVKELERLAKRLAAENEGQLRRCGDQVHRDWLTGIPNRRAFEERLREEWMRSRRTGGTFAVGMIDVDGLKEVNDSAGHLAGDRALQFVARALREKLRKIDFLARWGGDEFTVLMPDTSRPRADEALGRIQASLDESRSNSRFPAVSFSFGLAEERKAGSEVALMRYADNAMYRSKARRTRREGAIEMSNQQATLPARRYLFSSEAESRPRPPVHILLAEDDRDLRHLLAGQLRKEGCVVSEAGSGFEMLERLSDACLVKETLDLIITDIRMPGPTGLSVVQGLRNGHPAEASSTPVILMTAFGDESTHAEARRLGVVIFDKPFDVDEFRACAMRMVDRT